MQYPIARYSTMLVKISKYDRLREAEPLAPGIPTMPRSAKPNRKPEAAPISRPRPATAVGPVSPGGRRPRRRGRHRGRRRSGRGPDRARAGQPPARDGLGARRNFQDGHGRRQPVVRRRQAGSRGDRGRVLDGQARGDQPRVRRVRQGDELQDRGRGQADARIDHEESAAGIPPAAGGRARGRVAGVHPAGPGGPVEQRRELVVVGAGRVLESPGRPGLGHQGPGRSPGRSDRLPGRGGVLQVGREAVADRGRVGVRRPWRARTEAVRLGRRRPGGRRGGPV